MSKKVRGRPKTLDKSSILDVLMMSYWSEGVQNVSVNEICRRTGVSKPGLYREFGNEDDLTKAAIENYQKNVLTPMLSNLNGKVSLQDAVFGLHSVYKEDKKRPRGCLFVKMLEVQTSLGPKTLKVLKNIKKQSYEAYHAWAQELIREKQIKKDISVEFAASYINAQFDSTFAMIARGVEIDDAIKILALAFKAIEEA